MKIKVDVMAGACRLNTVLSVYTDEDGTAHISVDSQCAHVRRMADEITEADPFEEVLSRDGELFDKARSFCVHPACPVPTALLKAIEAAAGLALPVSPVISIAKEEE
ncbi:MAG: hypothetical protein IK026_04210 [Eubacteriaceae bacterium]|nr:hypothetical protein [Eubacteriaceae bacterium]MBR5995765.1 hypothetical protein [Eubacteriaceae bacterium]